jgi:hypothetical protein
MRVPLRRGSSLPAHATNQRWRAARDVADFRPSQWHNALVTARLTARATAAGVRAGELSAAGLAADPLAAAVGSDSSQKSGQRIRRACQESVGGLAGR